AQTSKSVVPIPGIRQASEALQGFIGFDPRYSVMDPEAESLASAYRGGESASVISDLVGALSPFAYASAMSKASQIPGMAELIAYHGSPHKFKKFDASKIGTGEGSQVYGHGLYFAENPEVAKNYAFGLANKQAAKELTKLSKSPDIVDQAAAARVFYDDAGIKEFITAKNKNLSKNEIDRIVSSSAEKYQKLQSEISGLYKVDIPDEKIAQMLDWDKPLSQQPKAVQDAINKSEYALRDEAMNLYGKKDPLGSEIARAALKPQEFAEHMRELGIPGIRYLDQGSRGTDKGTSNFVVFPGEEESIKMLEINNAPPMKKGGAVRISDNPDTMRLELLRKKHA
ncbi:MAG: hypothetical protein EB116_19265, partial [Betaproteobacteria bacterium]|nr:hypothetical protein [Betaproteobacteria bacterium]